MDDKIYRVARLIAAHIRQEINTEDGQELQNWVNASETNRFFFGECNQAEKLLNEVAVFDKWKTRRDEMFQKIQAGLITVDLQPKPVRKLKLRFCYMSAAAVLAIFFIVAYVGLLQKNENTAVVLQPQELRYKDIVHPATPSTRLTLANGRQFILDSLANGNLLQESGLEIIKETNQVIYRFNRNAANNKLSYSTMSTHMKKADATYNGGNDEQPTAGEEQLFYRMYSEGRDELYNNAYYFNRCRYPAENMLQGVFEKAW